MRGGSAPSWRQGQGWCPAEKAETAARCGFKVPVLEGARIVVDREMHALSSLVVTSARAAAGLHATDRLRWRRPGRSGRPGWVDPVALEVISPTGPGRTQPRRRRV